MKHVFLILSLFTLSTFGRAQQVDSCSCQANLKALVDVAKSRYAGFEDKISSKTLKQYNDLRQNLERQAQLTSPNGCLTILEKYVAFFKDDHFTIHYSDLTTALRKPVKANESPAQISRYLSAYQANLAPIEGIWRDIDDLYQVNIYKDKKDPKHYTGSIASTKVANWQAGLVKFRLKQTPAKGFEAVYYFRDFTPVHYTASLQGDILKFSGFGGYWVRTAAKFEKPAQLVQTIDLLTQHRQLPNLSFRVIDPNFCYLKLNSFNVADSAFNSVLIQYKEVISRTPHLIIDLRGNGGGCCSLDSWGEFIRLIYTQPIVDAGVTEKVGGKLISYPGRTVRRDSVAKMPQKIALLIDSGGASSAELLLEYARQSKKVTLFGSPTSGTMDYGAVRPYRLPCGTYEGYVATMRSDWTLHGKIDETGYQPDVLIGDYQFDWIQVVMAYYGGKFVPKTK
ncbi:S41 family peptidase [Spirosoma endophyticum]|uniref:Peptidase family S41 n=1 Tax=Spirosoma endophyticum TaxID=662367 RepID=A0A1I1ZN48_9BACT|nr:S41 family peptidase [Spirosoma endophyticum]SFE33111.1 Peptidase family S41 [Spirosoma endophyticum]